MKKITYLMMLALGVSAVSSNISADTARKERRKERREKNKERRHEIKENFIKTLRNAASSMKEGDPLKALKALKKGTDDGIKNWKNKGTLLKVSPQIMDQIQSAADSAYSKAEELVKQGNKDEAKAVIDNFSAEMSKQMDAAEASIAAAAA